MTKSVKKLVLNKIYAAKNINIHIKYSSVNLCTLTKCVCIITIIIIIINIFFITVTHNDKIYKQSKYTYNIYNVAVNMMINNNNKTFK